MDPQTRELRRNGSSLRLQEQPCQVLLALLRSPGRVVSREEFQEILWPDGTFVDYEQGLNKALARLRESLGEDADKPAYIETIPRRGYRFIGRVETSTEQSSVFVLRRWLPLGAGIGLAGLAAMALWLFLANRPARVTSIAVLPLQALSKGEEQELIADGMTEAIITNLAQVSAFRRVISHSSVLQFKSKPVPLPEVAKRLKVDAVLEGSVQAVGDRLRVNVRLLQLPNERPLWAQSFERTVGEILILQSEVSREVVVHARAELTTQERERFANGSQVNPVAWRNVQRAQELCQKWSDSDWDLAGRLLDEAARLQPDYPDIYATRAACGVHLLNKGGRPPASICPAARDSARKALDMDPHNAHATATRGMLRMMCEMDWRSALEDLEQAGIQAPHSSWVLQARGLAYAAMGRHDESIGIGSRMLDLAPDSLFEWMAAGFVRIYAGKYEESLSFLERSARIEPGNVWPKLELIFALNRLGRIEEARKLWLQARTMSPPREDIMKDVWVTEFEAAAGYRDDILETIRHWESRSESVYIAPLKIAELYAGVKDADQTMKWLEKAFQERSALLFWVNSDPVFDFLRGDPRFKDFGRRAGLPKVAGGG